MRRNPLLPMNKHTEPRRNLARTRPRSQQGVVLIIALILMVVISLLALTSLRNAGSSTRVAGNVRTTEMATQAADIALRHCESSVLALLTVSLGGSSSYATTFNAGDIESYSKAVSGSTGHDDDGHGGSTSAPPTWQNMAFWDGDESAATVYVLPLSLMNQPGMGETYKRAPECLVVQIPVVTSGSSVVSTTPSFIVTARGFGPAVPAVDTSRSRPVGSEVWLQSRIQIE
jgi:Tfp pilus assembly protein PilX